MKFSISKLNLGQVDCAMVLSEISQHSIPTLSMKLQISNRRYWTGSEGCSCYQASWVQTHQWQGTRVLSLSRVPSDSSKDYLPFRDNRWWSIKDRFFDLITFPVNFMNGLDLFSPRSVEKSYHDPVTVISFFSCVHYMINLYNTILNNSLWRYKADLELKQ